MHAAVRRHSALDHRPTASSYKGDAQTEYEPESEP